MGTDVLQAGYAKRDITPEVGVFLAGNGLKYQSEAVHDRLFARAVVLKWNDEWVAMVSCDLLSIEPKHVANVRCLLRSAGVGKPDHVFISCTHTHNGPGVAYMRDGASPEPDDHYVRRVEEAIAATIIEADRAGVAVSMKYARGLAHENFNRRMVTPDGEAHFYNPGTLRKRPALAELVGGVTDSELNAVQLLKLDGSVFLTLVHYAAHPLTIGAAANVISADFCGPLVEQLERQYAAPAMFIQGACGDLHCKGLFAGFERQREMADNLAREASRILEDPGASHCEPTLEVATRRVELPVDQPRREKWGWNPALFTDVHVAELGAVALGPVVFTLSPGEMCCELALRIKWCSPFAQTWFLFNCNSCCGYFSVPRTHREGGYEGDRGTCLEPEAGELIATTTLELCQAIVTAQVAVDSTEMANCGLPKHKG